MNLSQPVDLYLNNKKVISEIGNSDYVVLDSIDGLTVKKEKSHKQYEEIIIAVILAMMD